MSKKAWTSLAGLVGLLLMGIALVGFTAWALLTHPYQPHAVAFAMMSTIGMMLLVLSIGLRE